MNPIIKHIDDLLVVVGEQLKDPTADKVAARRTRAALETAKYCSMGIFANSPAAPKTAPHNATPGGCTCMVGTRSIRCPVHGARA